MTLPPSALLEGPRGRHLCLSVASGLHEPVWGAWLDAAWYPSRAALRAGLVTALAGVDVSPLQGWTSVEHFTGAVGDSVDRAMYWQPPDDQDVVAAAPEVVEALRPIATAIAAASGAQWWSTPVDLLRQRYVSLYEPGGQAVWPELERAAANVAAWKRRALDDDARARRDRPADPAAAFSGEWWSTPIGTGLIRTTRALPSSGAVELLWEEDGLGRDRAATWAMRPLGKPQIFEIDRPDTWVELVRRYPLDVTAARRHDWYRVTGRAGSWLIPDWEAVSQDYDAVHLTVLAYLATATRPLAIDTDNATMLAGFDPDETFWLTDTIETAEPTAEHWARTGRFGTADVEWEPTAPL